MASIVFCIHLLDTKLGLETGALFPFYSTNSKLHSIGIGQRWHNHKFTIENPFFEIDTVVNCFDMKANKCPLFFIFHFLSDYLNYLMATKMIPICFYFIFLFWQDASTCVSSKLQSRIVLISDFCEKKNRPASTKK